MLDDIILNKADIIERCILRVKEEYADNPVNLNNFTKQDSIILNIQRACEAAVDIAMHIIYEKKLGIPQNSRDAFDILQRNSFIDQETAHKMKSMTGFRNLAVHYYQEIDTRIILGIIQKNLSDLILFKEKVLRK